MIRRASIAALLFGAVLLAGPAAAAVSSRFSSFVKPPPSTTERASEPGQPSAEISGDGLVRAYMAAQFELNEARLHLARAFDLKELILELELERTALQSSSTLSTQKEVQRIQKSSQRADKAIGERLEKEQRLSEEGKVHYRASLEPYGSGLLKAAKLVPAAQRFGQQRSQEVRSKSIRGFQSFGKGLQAGLFVARSIPPFVSQARETYRQVRSFGRKLEIEMPPDATEALAALDGDFDTGHDIATWASTEPVEVAAVPPAPVDEVGFSQASRAPEPDGFRSGEATQLAQALPTDETPWAASDAGGAVADGTRPGLRRDWEQLPAAPHTAAAPRAESTMPVGGAGSPVRSATALWESWTRHYHLDGECAHIQTNSLRKMSVDEAEDRGLQPCRRCAGLQRAGS